MWPYLRRCFQLAQRKTFVRRLRGPLWVYDLSGKKKAVRYDREVGWSLLKPLVTQIGACPPVTVQRQIP